MVRIGGLGGQVHGDEDQARREYITPGFDRLFLRYYIKYDDAFPGAHHVGGALQARAPGVPDANPGVKPDGANKFDALAVVAARA